ncbi:hypothetical protein C8J56DRAFT_893354 [Mycena floridula]|nr:hypothetical protein C8J56DRAFT_893354 [Mycena floridula]
MKKFCGAWGKRKPAQVVNNIGLTNLPPGVHAVPQGNWGVGLPRDIRVNHLCVAYGIGLVYLEERTIAGGAYIPIPFNFFFRIWQWIMVYMTGPLPGPVAIVFAIVNGTLVEGYQVHHLATYSVISTNALLPNLFYEKHERRPRPPNDLGPLVAIAGGASRSVFLQLEVGVQIQNYLLSINDLAQ